MSDLLLFGLGLSLHSLIKYLITNSEPCLTATCKAVFPSTSTGTSAHVTIPGNRLIRYSARYIFSKEKATSKGVSDMLLFKLALSLHLLIKYLITISEPHSTATCKAVFPSLSARASVHVTIPGNSLTRYSATPIFPEQQATCSGVSDLLLYILGLSLHFSIRHLTISKWPHSAATCNAVFPLSSTGASGITLEHSLKSHLTTDKLPSSVAVCSGVWEASLSL